MRLKVLDLFSGIGGFSLGLERTGGFETVAFCEINSFRRSILRKNWPEVPIYDDVRTLNYDGPVDVICGGYPCQPFSTAGHRKGNQDERHLWPAMFNLVKKHRPAWVIGENVVGHVTMGLDAVLDDLESEDYSTRAFVIPAYGVGSYQERDRVWVVSHSKGQGKRREKGDVYQENGRQGRSLPQLLDGTVQVFREPKGWPIEPRMGGRLNGFSLWLDKFDMNESHMLLLANGEKEKRARKELLALRNSSISEKIWEDIRGFERISAKEVLFTYVRELKKSKSHKAWVQLASQETSEAELRSLWDEYKSSCASCRSEYNEQRVFEYPNFMQALPRILARDAEKAWVNYCRENAVPRGWEEGISKIAYSSPRQLDRTSALGDAVVPQIPEMIGKAILEAS